MAPMPAVMPLAIAVFIWPKRAMMKSPAKRMPTMATEKTEKPMAAIDGSMPSSWIW